MKTLAILCALSGALFGQVPAVWATLRSELTDHRGLSIRLGDVADVQGTDAVAIDAARRLVIGEQSAGGRARVIDRETIERLLEHEARGRFAIKVIGADRVTVRAADGGLSQSEIEALAERFLQAELKGFSGDPRIASLRADGPLPAVAGAISARYEVRFAEKSPRDRGLIQLEVAAVTDGREVATTRVLAEVQRDAQVVIVKRPVPAGREIGPDDLELAAKTLDGTNPTALTDPALAIGRIARTRLAKGQWLTLQHVKEAPVLFRRDQVVVEAMVGALVVEGRGTVMEDGSIGDSVKVRMEPSNKQIIARVIDSRRVRLETP